MERGKHGWEGTGVGVGGVPCPRVVGAAGLGSGSRQRGAGVRCPFCGVNAPTLADFKPPGEDGTTGGGAGRRRAAGFLRWSWFSALTCPALPSPPTSAAEPGPRAEPCLRNQPHLQHRPLRLQLPSQVHQSLDVLRGGHRGRA